MPSKRAKTVRKRTKKQPILKKVNWYGFDHKAVAKKFGGDLTFVNYMCLDLQGLGYYPVAVYHAANPDRSKGHKDYMLLFTVYNPHEDKSLMYVSGRTKEELEKERMHGGILCLECNTVIISIARHDYETCDCKNKAMTDGGKDYGRYGAMDLNKIKGVQVDLLTDKITITE